MCVWANLCWCEWMCERAIETPRVSRKSSNCTVLSQCYELLKRAFALVFVCIFVACALIHNFSILLLLLRYNRHCRCLEYSEPSQMCRRRRKTSENDTKKEEWGREKERMLNRWRMSFKTIYQYIFTDIRILFTLFFLSLIILLLIQCCCTLFVFLKWETDERLESTIEMLPYTFQQREKKTESSSRLHLILCFLIFELENPSLLKQ